MYREQKEATRQVLCQLSNHAQEALRLRYQERLRYVEVPARTACSAEAARKLYVRARHDVGVACALWRKNDS